MLNILGMIILIIILFIIILLLIGIRIKLEYDKKGSKLKGCLKILIFKKIKIYSITFPSKDDDDEESKDEKKDRDIRKIYELAKPCFGDLLDYLKSSLKIVKVIKIDNHLIFGMDSYADTGKYIGIIWSVFAMINSLHDKLRLSAEPSFTGNVLDGYGINELDIYPLKLFIPTIKLVSKKEVRALIRGVIDAR
jgi:hypothetical protein